MTADHLLHRTACPTTAGCQHYWREQLKLWSRPFVRTIWLDFKAVVTDETGSSLMDWLDLPSAVSIWQASLSKRRRAEMQLCNHYLIVMDSILWQCSSLHLIVMDSIPWQCSSLLLVGVENFTSRRLLTLTLTLKGKAISWEQTAGHRSDDINNLHRSEKTLTVD